MPICLTEQIIEQNWNRRTRIWLKGQELRMSLPSKFLPREQTEIYTFRA